LGAGDAAVATEPAAGPASRTGWASETMLIINPIINSQGNLNASHRMDQDEYIGVRLSYKLPCAALNGCVGISCG